MSAPEFDRQAAERRLGPAVLADIRRLVDEAPPLSTEQLENLRSMFASARAAAAVQPSSTRAA
ncbi:hypothetical protein [Streptomyces sp. CS014]|uniref:hypothetical protein n=1 Tax=Streptomyces sp. CS014 TaxID=2162707 RepID=UPI000D52193F|nr:hypothetical protein [Streptomyces sp. CS014]PVD01304.1 hypothetical protein DBP12_07240 [Streptomyces sp. CS014]